MSFAIKVARAAISLVTAISFFTAITFTTAVVITVPIPNLTDQRKIIALKILPCYSGALRDSGVI